MSNDPFVGLIAIECSDGVGPFEALTRGIPEGACFEVALTPLTGFILLVALGGMIAGLQIFVRKMVFGRRDRYRTLSEDTSGISQREIANRARAREQPGGFR